MIPVHYSKTIFIGEDKPLSTLNRRTFVQLFIWRSADRCFEEVVRQH